MSTGLVADLSCCDDTGTVVVAVEIKDRKLTLHDVQAKLPGIRERGIRELLFLMQGGIEKDDQEAAEALIAREFNAGQNIYACEFDTFLQISLVLFGEHGRRRFLEMVGSCIDEMKADTYHRQAWSDILGSL